MSFGVGSDLPAACVFEDATGAGVDGLTVKVDGYNHLGVKVIDDEDATPMGGGTGAYTWLVDGALVTGVGGFLIKFRKTAGGTTTKSQQNSYFTIVPWVVANVPVVAVATIVNNAITANAIAADALTAAKIANGALTAAKFAAGAFAGVEAALLDAADGVENGETVRQLFVRLRAFAGGRTADAGGGVFNYLRPDNATVAYAVTLNSTTNLRTNSTTVNLDPL